jgi:hypothetical protein
LLGFYQNELKKLEEQHTGLRILGNINNGYFIGPKKIHSTVKEELHRWAAKSQQKQFTIEDQCFGSISTIEEKQVIEICLSHGCLVQMKFKFINKSYLIPMSCLDKRAVELIPAAMSIDIRIGDLATQSVDMVVVCSTSHYLLNDILEKAGTEVEDKVNAALRSGQITCNGYETAGGQLLCQRLFFLPWTTEKLDNRTLRQTIQMFFTTAIHHAVKTKKTSLAFPALGCGELKYDPNIIAEIILEETQRYASYNLKILIVLLPKKTENYRAFCVKLAELRQKTSSKNPSKIIYPHISKHLVYLL